MEPLTRRDERALLGFLGEIYIQRDLATFSRPMLEAVRRVVDSDYTVYQEIDGRTREIGETVQHPEGVVQPGDVPRFKRHMGDNPLLEHFSRNPRSGPRKISDFLTRREFRRTASF